MFYVNTKFFIFFLLSMLKADQNNIIARVGNQTIFTNDVIERAEYTPRPMYCRGNSFIDKKIIVNTLIGEKLFSKEYKEKNLPEDIQNYLIGRKNQKMRDLLYNEIINDNIYQQTDYSHWYELADYEYDFNYLTVRSSEIMDKIDEQILNGFDLNKVYQNLSNNNNMLSTKDNVNIFNIDNYHLRTSLFSQKRFVGEIIGPVKVDDNFFMYYEISDLTKKININNNDRIRIFNEINEIIDHQSNQLYYEKYVESVMSGLEMKLNDQSFRKFTNLVSSWYNDNQKFELEKQDFSNTLVEIGKDSFSIDEILSMIKIHPLQFRNGYFKKMTFNQQLKYALADLIRDIYLNTEAKKMGLDNHVAVINEYEKWYDNFRAVQNRKSIVGDINFSSMNVPKVLNQYFTKLAKKHSNDIWINIKAIESLSLSSIDMVVLNDNKPYEVFCPTFPVITSHHQFDYGRRLDLYEN
ncbi:MAG: hypothetical protein CMG07_03430 [Candidatus Marinimicrobia bacterium]|nr:hypothetical protein [Candidatus Neomarinimicrobiota bacterium]|tara:strand:- start:220 stop:1614 length:1395 start_codon:yes stop_codon:yes gene_type:complete